MITDAITNRIRHQRQLRSGQTIYFGSFLPIYAYAENGFTKTTPSVSKIASIYGFEDDKFIRLPYSKFEEHGVSDKEVSKYAYKENLQFNEHLIGSDVQALRMAMVLTGEGEPIETLKELYDKIHLYFAMGLPRTWESILKHLPSLKERYEKSHPQKKISERLFGKENEEYERFVQSVRIKSIDRIPENTNKNTFDYIHVEVRLSGTIPQETRLYLCKKYARAIGRHVLIVIEESPRFQKFGVPSNILKLEKATLGRDATLYMTMGIKERQCWS